MDVMGVATGYRHPKNQLEAVQVEQTGPASSGKSFWGRQLAALLCAHVHFQSATAAQPQDTKQQHFFMTPRENSTPFTLSLPAGGVAAHAGGNGGT